MKSKLRAAVLGTALLIGAASTANASLIGDTVSFDRIFNGASQLGNPSAVVGGGIEFNDSSYSTSDISASSIRIDFNLVSFNTGTPLQFYRWDSLDWLNNPNGVITGVDVTFGGSITTNGVTPIPPAFSAANVTFTDHRVEMQVGGYLFDSAFVQIDLQTNHDVAEPGTLAILGLGLVGLGFARRRKAA